MREGPLDLGSLGPRNECYCTERFCQEQLCKCNHGYSLSKMKSSMLGWCIRLSRTVKSEVSGLARSRKLNFPPHVCQWKYTWLCRSPGDFLILRKLFGVNRGVTSPTPLPSSPLLSALQSSADLGHSRCLKKLSMPIVTHVSAVGLLGEVRGGQKRKRPK